MPPRGSIQSAILQEIIYRERLRLWKSQEIKVSEELFQLAATEKTYEELSKLRSTLMRMALHLAGAYDVKERPANSEETPRKKSDAEMLALLDKLPELNG